MKPDVSVNHSAANPFLLIDPNSVWIPVAIAMAGFSRSQRYKLIKSGEFEITKGRGSTLVMVASLRAAVKKRRAPR